MLIFSVPDRGFPQVISAPSQSWATPLNLEEIVPASKKTQCSLVCFWHPPSSPQQPGQAMLGLPPWLSQRPLGESRDLPGSYHNPWKKTTCLMSSHFCDSGASVLLRLFCPRSSQLMGTVTAFLLSAPLLHVSCQNSHPMKPMHCCLPREQILPQPRELLLEPPPPSEVE